MSRTEAERSRSAHDRRHLVRAPVVEALECRRLFSAADPAGGLLAAAALPALPHGVGANVAITSDPGVQQMPSVAADPTNPRHLVVASMDYSLVSTGYAGIGVADSRDGGATWRHSAVPLPAGFDQGAANPMVRFEADGRAYVSFMAATFLGQRPPLTNPDGKDPDTGVRLRTLGFTASNGIFVARSDDGGLTWPAPPVAVASRAYTGQPVPFDIMPDLAVDTFRTLPDGSPNPRFGTLYAVWTRYYPPGQFPGQPTSTGGSMVFVAASLDGGRTWQTRTMPQQGTGAPVSVIQDSFFTGIGPPPGLGAANWSHAAVGPAGDLYVSYYDFGNFAVARSADGGVTFDEADAATGRRFVFGTNGDVNTHAAAGTSNLDAIRSHVVRQIVADPTRPGVVYAAEPVEVVGPDGNVLDNSDVYFARSTDFGVTWQAQNLKIGTQPADVLNDENGGHKATGRPDDVAANQAAVRLAIDDQGDLALVWYDTRRDPAGHRLDVYGTVSTDGGQTFAPNFRVSDTSFDADAGQFTDATGRPDKYLGDFTGLALAGGKAYAAWADTRAGNQDVEFAPFDLNPAPPPFNDRLEPNDAPAAATDLGSVIRTRVPKLTLAAGDEDWFRLRATATGELTVGVSSADAAAAAELRLELRDASGAVVLASGIAGTAADGTSGQEIHFQGVSGSTYYVRVSPAAGAMTPITYELRAQSLTADLGTAVHGTQGGTLAAGDQAYYLLSAGVAGSLQARLTPGPDVRGSLHVDVLDTTTLAVLASGAPDTGAGTGADQAAVLQVTEGQSVLIRVAGDTGAATPAQGSYRLEFTNFDVFAGAQAVVGTAGSTDHVTLVFPAGAGPSQVAVGDLNGDGKPDLVVSDALSNTVSTLLGNGDGTFQAPRPSAVGAFVAGSTTKLVPLNTFRRDVAIADLNRDGIPDVVVTNNDSSDVSVLLGRGDGTFQPQRRFDATTSPFALDVGDLNGDGVPDLAVIDSTTGPISIAVLLGKGDGTFLPQRLIPSTARDAFALTDVKIADVNGDGRNDLVLTGGNDQKTQVLLNNGDAAFPTFRPGDTSLGAGPGLLVADLNGDGIPDEANANFYNNTVSFALGKGDGTFGVRTEFFGGQAPAALALADLGSPAPDGSPPGTLGPPDGKSDLIVAASGTPQTAFTGPAAVNVLPAGIDDNGNFAYGAPVQLASGSAPQSLAVSDVNGDGTPDVAFVDRDGVRVVFGKPPAIAPNITPQTARNLGTVVHLLEPTLSIVPGRSDAYFKLTVPGEAVRGAGDEVLDFSALFRDAEGAGLNMEVRDVAGNLLGSGSRFRLRAAPGQVLTVHVFGVANADGTAGAGAYTLDVDVLAQPVTVEAQPLVPAAAGRGAGPTSTLVLTFQGDRLDPASAENPANYKVTFLGADGVAGTADDRVFAVAPGTAESPGAVYDPGANVDVASGRAFPTAVRQTVTLAFNTPLPAGSYRVEVSPAVQAAAFSDQEAGLLAVAPGGTSGGASAADHPVVSIAGGQVDPGAALTVSGLVPPADRAASAAMAADDFTAGGRGTRFLTQLHDDLGALLDQALTQRGDDPSVTPALLRQILLRFTPALRAAAAGGQVPLGALVIFLDPVDLDLEDPSGARVTYDAASGNVSGRIPNTFVSVAGNVEVIAVPILGAAPGVATAAAGGSAARAPYTLTVNDVQQTSRGGAAVLGAGASQTVSLTDGIRAGERTFLFEVPVQLGLAAVVATASRGVSPIAGPLVAPQRAVPTGDNAAAGAAVSVRRAAAETSAVPPPSSPEGADRGDTDAGTRFVLVDLGQDVQDGRRKEANKLLRSLRRVKGLADDWLQGLLHKMEEQPPPQGPAQPPPTPARPTSRPGRDDRVGDAEAGDAQEGEPSGARPASPGGPDVPAEDTAGAQPNATTPAGSGAVAASDRPERSTCPDRTAKKKRVVSDAKRAAALAAACFGLLGGSPDRRQARRDRERRRAGRRSHRR